MPFISHIPHEDAEGLLAELYERFADPSGRVDPITRIHPLDPPSMDHHLRMYYHLMKGPSPLTRVQREMIAVAVSSANDCFY